MCLPNFGVHRAGIDRSGIASGHGVIIAAIIAFMAMMLMRVVAMMRVLVDFAFGNKVHSAFGAIAGPILPDVRMHRADVDGCVFIGVGVVLVIFHVFSSIGNSFERPEFCPSGDSTIADIANVMLAASGSARVMALVMCGMLSVVITRAAPAARTSS